MLFARKYKVDYVEKEDGNTFNRHERLTLAKLEELRAKPNVRIILIDGKPDRKQEG